MIRREGSIEGALQDKFHLGSSAKGNKGKGKKENHGNYEETTTTNVFLQLNTTETTNILHTNIVGGEIILTSSIGGNLI